LIRRGFTVFGSVRKDSDGKRVRGELGEKFIPLVFDVTDAAAIARAVAEVENCTKGAGLAGLVNNAGIAKGGPLNAHADRRDSREL